MRALERGASQRPRAGKSSRYLVDEAITAAIVECALTRELVHSGTSTHTGTTCSRYCTASQVLDDGSSTENEFDSTQAAKATAAVGRGCVRSGKVTIRPALRSLLVGIVSASSTGVCIAQEQTRSPARVVTDWIESLPTQPLLYVMVSGLAALYAWWRLRQWHNRYGRAGDGHPAYVPTNQTIVVKLLRRRAFNLETWAHCMLAGIIATLFGGLYFIIFVLQQVVTVSDVETIRQSEFDERFGVTLDRIVDGHFWLKVAEVPALAGQGPIAAALFSDTRTGTEVHTGVVARDKGPVFVTEDGGRTWTQSRFEREFLEDGEWLVAGAFAMDGSRGVLFGSLGTFWSTADEGRSWSTVDRIEGTRATMRDPSESIRNVTKAVITDSLVVAKTSSGSTFVNIGSDKPSSYRANARTNRWQELTNLHLRADPDLAAMALNHDAGVIAMHRSEMFTSKDGGATWKPTELEWPGGWIEWLNLKNGRLDLLTGTGMRLTENATQ